MRLLLDTHTFLWALSAPSKLPKNARTEIESRSNEVFVSAISFWEIAIKTRIKKLKLGWDDDLIVATQNVGFVPIALTPEEAASYGELTESTHGDPFDRMLIWQAIQRNLTLVSGDPEFNKFKSDGLKLLWK
ncbi:MAG: type II toxin-antitoxin system VapC family toxin [Acidobacteriota bacterium]